MVAYSFQRRFAPPILAGTKPHTIRADRKRHARPGEQLQLYIGMRTKSCQLIARTVCVAVNPIQISFGILAAVVIGDQNQHDLDAFAVSDGFTSWADMEDFWRRQHGQHGMIAAFIGVIIEWDAKSLTGGMADQRKDTA